MYSVEVSDPSAPPSGAPFVSKSDAFIFRLDLDFPTLVIVRLAVLDVMEVRLPSQMRCSCQPGMHALRWHGNRRHETSQRASVETVDQNHQSSLVTLVSMNHH